YQCAGCRHQTSLIAGTMMENTKLPLTKWFLAIYLISQAKTVSVHPAAFFSEAPRC
ncbi:MAG: hypothetical protein RJA99_1887, partial [Pseudomonadota bacterium]